MKRKEREFLAMEDTRAIDFSAPVALDKKDKAILRVLSQNGRMPISQISKKTRFGREVIKYRIKKMEDENVISGYMAVLNPPKYGFGVVGDILMRFGKTAEGREKEFIDTLRKDPYVTCIYTMGGSYDFRIEITARNLAHFHRILRNIRLNFSDIIKECDTSFIMKEYKWTHFPDEI